MQEPQSAQQPYAPKLSPKLHQMSPMSQSLPDLQPTQELIDFARKKEKDFYASIEHLAKASETNVDKLQRSGDVSIQQPLEQQPSGDVGIQQPLEQQPSVGVRFTPLERTNSDLRIFDQMMDSSTFNELSPEDPYSSNHEPCAACEGADWLPHDENCPVEAALQEVVLSLQEHKCHRQGVHVSSSSSQEPLSLFERRQQQHSKPKPTIKVVARALCLSQRTAMERLHRSSSLPRSATAYKPKRALKSSPQRLVLHPTQHEHKESPEQQLCDETSLSGAVFSSTRRHRYSSRYSSGEVEAAQIQQQKQDAPTPQRLVLHPTQHEHNESPEQQLCDETSLCVDSHNLRPAVQQLSSTDTSAQRLRTQLLSQKLQLEQSETTPQRYVLSFQGRGSTVRENSLRKHQPTASKPDSARSARATETNEQSRVTVHVEKLVHGPLGRRLAETWGSVQQHKQHKRHKSRGSRILSPQCGGPSLSARRHTDPEQRPTYRGPRPPTRPRSSHGDDGQLLRSAGEVRPQTTRYHPAGSGTSPWVERAKSIHYRGLRADLQRRNTIVRSHHYSTMTPLSCHEED